MEERSRQKNKIFSIIICIAKPHKRIRTTSSYNQVNLIELVFAFVLESAINLRWKEKQIKVLDDLIVLVTSCIN